MKKDPGPTDWGPVAGRLVGVYPGGRRNSFERAPKLRLKHTCRVVGIDEIWARIERHAGRTFRTINKLEFTYRVPGGYLRITREGREINRSLSRTNFARALASMPAYRPGDIKDRQGSAYTWAILMDDRIREHDS